ncbi:MAG TPA: ABC transporter ATP-binding protein [Longimicrobiales bacterium]|nr:ABC transporter ATP-binding protein [Longimicrobiales bacterium]
MTGPVFDTKGLVFRYPATLRDAVAGIDLRVNQGEFTALLGPNGSGKSTLLRMLLGALRPTCGEVLFRGRPAGEWPRDELARQVGVVAQAEEIAFPITVREFVAMGRYPHLGAWRREGPADRAAILGAMDRCGVADLGQRSVMELSGGERQRARLARALAQEPRILVLDEPTAALDIAHEMSLFELLADLVDDGVTVVVVTHNINIAARYARRLVLLDGGRIVVEGPPSRVLEKSTLETVYQWPVRIRLEDGAPQVVPEKRDAAEE